MTKNGTDPLLPEEENCAEIVEPPTDTEMDRAITGNMANLMIVMKAVKHFKARVARKRPMLLDSILGRDAQLVAPPEPLQRPRELTTSRSIDAFDRRPVDQALATEGVHREIEVNDNLEKLPIDMDHVSVVPKALIDQHTRDILAGDKVVQAESIERPFQHRHPRAATFPLDDHAKGHAHDPLQDLLYLNIGIGGSHPHSSMDPEHAEEIDMIVSESPPAIDAPIYEQAYQDEMRRILAERGERVAMYLNRRVEHRQDISRLIQRSRDFARTGIQSLQESGRFADVVKQAQDQIGSAGQIVGETVKATVDDNVSAFKEARAQGRAQDQVGAAAQNLGQAFKAAVDDHVSAFKEARAQVRDQRKSG